MESSQEVQELENSPVLVSEKGTFGDVPEDGSSGAEHANLEEPQETPLIAPGDHVHVPDAIAWMMQNGVDFSRTKDSWPLSEDNVSLKKPFSVYFTLETLCSHNDIVMGLVDASVEYAYGTVLSFRRDLAADSIFNGIRTARMRVTKNIPLIGANRSRVYPHLVSWAA